MELVMWQMVAGGSTREAVALLERLNETAGIVIPSCSCRSGSRSDWRASRSGSEARAVQSWMAIFVAAGDPARGRVRSGAERLAIVAAAFLVVGLGAIGRMVLRETDEAWEHTPNTRASAPCRGCASPEAAAAAAAQ